MHRLEHEYNAPARLERLGYSYPRWVIGSEEAINRVARDSGRMKLYDAKGNPLLVFSDQWALRATLERDTGLQFLDGAP